MSPNTPPRAPADTSQPPQYLPGQHLLVDFAGVNTALLSDREHLQASLREAARAAGAHEIAAHFHHFGPGQGVTGMLLLRESHISIHTWPELELAVIDIFMCGSAEPQRAVTTLHQRLQPRQVSQTAVLRGLVGANNAAGR